MVIFENHHVLAFKKIKTKEFPNQQFPFIRVIYNMKVYTKEWTQFIPRPLDEIWEFFSRPENLNKVTPKEMNFNILTDITNKPMYEGMIINYKVSPLLGIPMRWTTEIQRIKQGEYFVDEQRFGPYAMWHHEHHFREADGGTYMTDLLHYAIPFGVFGNIANALFVDAKIEEIFKFRVAAVERLFGKTYDRTTTL